MLACESDSHLESRWSSKLAELGDSSEVVSTGEEADCMCSLDFSMLRNALTSGSKWRGRPGRGAPPRVPSPVWRIAPACPPAAPPHEAAEWQEVVEPSVQSHARGGRGGSRTVSGVRYPPTLASGAEGGVGLRETAGPGLSPVETDSLVSPKCEIEFVPVDGEIPFLYEWMSPNVYGTAQDPLSVKQETDAGADDPLSIDGLQSIKQEPTFHSSVDCCTTDTPILDTKSSTTDSAKLTITSSNNDTYGQETTADGATDGSSEEQCSGDTYTRPPFYYAELIAMAIKHSPQRRATLMEICTYIAGRFPYYRRRRKGLHKLLSDQLSRKKCFVKLPKERHIQRCCYWTLDQRYEELFENGIYRREQRRKLPFSRARVGAETCPTQRLSTLTSTSPSVIKVGCANSAAHASFHSGVDCCTADTPILYTNPSTTDSAKLTITPSNNDTCGQETIADGATDGSSEEQCSSVTYTTPPFSYAELIAMTIEHSLQRPSTSTSTSPSVIKVGCADSAAHASFHSGVDCCTADTPILDTNPSTTDSAKLTITSSNNDTCGQETTANGATDVSSEEQCSSFTNTSPPFSYAELIAMAIKHSPQRRATLMEICTYITGRFPYYRHRRKGLQKLLSDQLSRKKCFLKLPKECRIQRCCYWTLDQQYEDYFENDIRRRKRRKKLPYDTACPLPT